MRLAFLASHNGSSAKAITLACDNGMLAADPVLMISNNPDCPAFSWAKDHKVKTFCLNEKLLRSAEAVDREIGHVLEDHRIDLVVCSGYMKLIGPQTIRAAKGRILNVHPALLPRHGGKGLYGRKVHEAVIAEGDSETGITIHLVDEEYDHGRILAQHCIPVAPGDMATDIEAKVKAAEPDFYIDTLRRLLAGEISI
jgi:phosphoribosylglycinamide formyltransferase-1